MNSFTKLFLLAIAALILLSCESQNNSITIDQISLIPTPHKIENRTSSFELGSKSSITINNRNLLTEAEYLQTKFNPATGFQLEINESSKITKGNIHLHLDSNKKKWEHEAYTLHINKSNIILESGTSEGIFRGIQTLRQLLPHNIESATLQNISWLIPCGIIHDKPKYAYRGAMLDVSRHFFTVSEVKKYIDQLALYKINNLHLHLTDDQGWRIEIKSWPKLTEIGATSSVNNEKSGFYTQNQYKDLVAYAASQYITIVPEIDMPGHTNAALASYAELNENNKTTELYSGMEVGFSSFAIHKEVTYQFVDDVLRELSAITPGPYIHIGGDESHATNHDDYVYFMNSVLNIVSKYDKKAIGWDEMAHANIDSNYIIQFWSNKQNTKLGLSKGAKVIFSPAKYAYLDMKYDSTTVLGLDWAGTTEVDKAYNWLPDTIIQNISKEQILGIEAPLWSETVLSNADIEYMAFPRLCGIAEIGWSKNDALIWDNYKLRLAKHKSRFETLNINYYKSKMVEWD